MRHRQLFLTALFLVGCDGGSEHGDGHHQTQVVMGRIPPVLTATEHAPEHEGEKSEAAHSAAGEAAHGTAEAAAVPVEGEGEGEAVPAEGEAVPAEGEAAPPVEAEAVPAEGEAVAGEGEAPPAEGEAAPPVEAEAPAPAGGGNADELAKRAKILFGSAKVDGGLEADAVRKVIKKKKAQLAKCYAQGLVKDAALAGKITLEFVIDKKGKTKDAKLKSSSFGDAAIESCMVEAVAGWKFDAPSDGGKVKVKYPLTFSPG